MGLVAGWHLQYLRSLPDLPDHYANVPSSRSMRGLNADSSVPRRQETAKGAEAWIHERTAPGRLTPKATRNPSQ